MVVLLARTKLLYFRVTLRYLRVRVMGKRDSCNIVRDFVEWHGSFEDKLINTIHSCIIFVHQGLSRYTST